MQGRTFAGLAIAVAAIGVSGVLPSSASAGNVSSGGSGNARQLTYFAGSGEANVVTVRIGDESTTITDKGAAVTSQGCDGATGSTVTCPVGASHQNSNILIELNDGDDSVRVIGRQYNQGLLPTSGLRVTLKGGAGNDTLRGGRGNDLLYDGPGDDRVFGYQGNDEFFNHAGSDSLDGGRGVNNLHFLAYEFSLYGPSVQIRDSGVALTLGDNKFNDGGSVDVGSRPGDRIKNFAIVNGTPYDDTLVGDRMNNNLSGGDGDDVVDGQGGVDLISGGDGVDSMRGGAGSDLFNSYAFTLSEFSMQPKHDADALVDCGDGEDRYRSDSLDTPLGCELPMTFNDDLHALWLASLDL